MSRPGVGRGAAAAWLVAAWLVAAPAHAAEAAPDARRLEPLVPAIDAAPYRLAAGPRPFRDRLVVSPGYGRLGTEQLFALRLGWNPSDWLGWEAGLGHNPGESVHAVLHTFGVVVRRPFPGRLQPYLSAGYGMLMVHPGLALNADPVTKNALTAGGGLEVYLREDLALRADLRQARVFANQRGRDGVVVYDYAQGTLGLAFYRTVRP
jgi:hypothetical protein